MPKKHKKVARVQGSATFAYFSTCCEAPAKKPTLEMPRDNRIGRLGSSPKDADDSGLGGWRCSKCGRPAKVTRTKAVTAANALRNRSDEPIAATA